MSKIRKQKPIIEPTRYDKNRIAFVAIENEWHTVRIGYIRELTGEGKSELERIYREELDQNWLPNRYCKGCYFKAGVQVAFPEEIVKFTLA